MPLSTIEYLRHIRDELNFLVESREGLEEEDFFHNPVLQRAFTRSLEIIGEATKQIDPEIIKRFPEIPWKSMAHMRDKLVHHYFGIDYEIVWDILVEEIPDLRSRLINLIAELEK